jgi:general secretion pathway protein G
LVEGITPPNSTRKIRFLRRMPRDPMTGKEEWGFRSIQDEPKSDSWGGQNVYDVYSKSGETALNGTKYKDW